MAAAPGGARVDPEGCRLSEQLCFAFYSANLALGRACKPVLDRLGLTFTQTIAIIALSEAGPLTVGELGERLFLQSNTLTPLLKRLETMGYVRRRRSLTDERQVRVELTEAGRRLPVDALGEEIAGQAGLPAADAPALRQLIVMVRDQLLHGSALSRRRPRS
jgi:DNA-binding MarR family transcriptional regulator